MKGQTVDINVAIAKQGKGLENVEPVLHDCRKDDEKRFSAVANRLNDVEGNNTDHRRAPEKGGARPREQQPGARGYRNNSATAGEPGQRVQPRHITLGGWPDTAPMETLLAEARVWFGMQPDLCCSSHTPRRSTTRSPNAVARGAQGRARRFGLQKALRDEGRTSALTGAAAA